MNDVFRVSESSDANSAAFSRTSVGLGPVKAVER